MEHCDTLLLIGSSFPYVEFLARQVWLGMTAK